MTAGPADNKYKTEQESFWAGEFGDDYRARNDGNDLLTCKTVYFGEILKTAPNVKSILELGCNIGLNLVALKNINSKFELSGYEINEKSAEIARQRSQGNIKTGTIIEKIADTTAYDLVFTAGVLIHINPDHLPMVYENMYCLSKKYIALIEYYNPNPVEVNYRGHSQRLYKRDFAGELIDRYGLNLINYGFIYHRDNYFNSDDLNWFLLEK